MKNTLARVIPVHPEFLRGERVPVLWTVPAEVDFPDRGKPCGKIRRELRRHFALVPAGAQNPGDLNPAWLLFGTGWLNLPVSQA